MRWPRGQGAWHTPGFLSRPCSHERLGPLGWAMLPACWLLREAVWAARAGLAVAPWDSLAHSGERETKITLE